MSSRTGPLEPHVWPQVEIAATGRDAVMSSNCTGANERAPTGWPSIAAAHESSISGFVRVYKEHLNQRKPRIHVCVDLKEENEAQLTQSIN